MSELQQKLKELYEQELFFKLNIDPQTGKVDKELNGRKIKFATFPFVGENYGKSKRIHIVGLDIGQDETIGTIQSFEERRKNILPSTNPHIAGTYFTALHFLREISEFDETWNKLPQNIQCSTILNHQQQILPKSNPLSYITISNFFKFVTEKRIKRTGNEDRILLNNDIESDFFMKEVELLNPDIIIFQGMKEFFRHCQVMKRLQNTGTEVYIGYHPSYWGKHNKIPENLISNLEKIKTLHPDS